MILGTITPQVFALQVPTVSSNISLTSVATTTVLNFTGGPGVLNMLSVVVAVGLSANTVTATLNVTVDGASAIQIPVYTAGILWDLHAMAMATFLINPGGVANNMLQMLCSIRFQNSLVVALNVSASTLTTGQVTVGVNWSHN